MQKTFTTPTATVLLALGIFAASGQAPAQPRGVLSILHPNQPVSIREVAGRYEIGIIADSPGPLGYKVVEVGSDFLVVEDVGGISETRIAIYSIKAVVVVRDRKAK